MVEVKTEYNQEKKRYTIYLKQSCPQTPETKNKKPFIIPIKF
ncbi:DUF3458 domain-containing protein [bacterium]|nr:DUF3458 domain-containing protein [bacterium]